MLNIKPCELIISTEYTLTEEELQVLVAVAQALSGVRLDLRLQEIFDIAVEMYATKHSFDEIGLAILGAVASGDEVH